MRLDQREYLAVDSSLGARRGALPNSSDATSPKASRMLRAIRSCCKPEKVRYPDPCGKYAGWRLNAALRKLVTKALCNCLTPANGKLQLRSMHRHRDTHTLLAGALDGVEAPSAPARRWERSHPWRA